MATVPSSGLKKPRQLPPSVLQAKLNNDSETLSRLGQMGNSKKARMRAAQKVRAAQAEIEANEIADELIEQDHRATIMAGAYAHAIRTRVAWDDDYTSNS